MTIATEKTADVFSRAELAELLECDEATLDEWARRGDLPGVKFGRSWVFPREAVLESLNEIARARRADVKRERSSRVKTVSAPPGPAAPRKRGRPITAPPALPTIPRA